MLEEKHWMYQIFDGATTEATESQAAIGQQSHVFFIPDEENAAEIISPGYAERCRTVMCLKEV